MSKSEHQQESVRARPEPGCKSCEESASGVCTRHNEHGRAALARESAPASGPRMSSAAIGPNVVKGLDGEFYELGTTTGAAQLSKDYAPTLTLTGNDVMSAYFKTSGGTLQPMTNERADAIAAALNTLAPKDNAPTPREELFKAANTAAMNLRTSMNLSEHPKSCECYGCGLSKAVIDYALKQGWENTREIREREAQYEKPSQGLMEMILDAAPKDNAAPDFVGVDLASGPDRAVYSIHFASADEAQRAATILATHRDNAAPAAQMLREFVGFISVEYGWPQERWENCGKLVDLFHLCAADGRRGYIHYAQGRQGTKGQSYRI